MLPLCSPLLSGAHIFFIIGKELLPCNGHFAYTDLDISPEAQGRAIYLLKLFHALLDQDTPVIMRSNNYGFFQLGAAMSLAYSYRRAEIRRLYKHGIGKLLLHLVKITLHIRSERTAVKIDIGQYRQARTAEGSFHKYLIHARCAAKYAAACIRYSRKLQQPLKRTVLAVQAVHRRYCNINIRNAALLLFEQRIFCFIPIQSTRSGIRRQTAACKLRIGRIKALYALYLSELVAGIPISFAGNIHRYDIILILIKIFHHLKRGNNRNIMLHALSSEKHCYFKLIHKQPPSDFILVCNIYSAPPPFNRQPTQVSSRIFRYF